MDIFQLKNLSSRIEAVIESRQNIFAKATDHLRPYLPSQEEFAMKTLPELRDMCLRLKKEIEILEDNSSVKCCH